MAAIPGGPGVKRCRCGARRDKTARRCAKCQARACYRRSQHYQEIARRRANQFHPIRNQRKDTTS